MPWNVNWSVLVDGSDKTEAMRPYLIDISVEDKAGSASDACALSFDDAGGQVRLPRAGAGVRVVLEGIPVFEGTVDSVMSSGSRDQGRKLKVKAKGFDARGKIIEPQRFNLDDATLQDFLGTAAEHAGLSVSVDPDLAKVARDYWSAEGESLVHLGQRLARELHGTFKIRGAKAVLAKRGVDRGLPTILGTVGDRDAGNVLAWDIAPITTRRVFTRARVAYFDRASATHKFEETGFTLDRDLPDSVNFIRAPVRNAAQAKAVGKAREAEAAREAGEGSVEIDLEPMAQAEALFVLQGARAGVDGTYRIVSVTHRATRSGGSTTRLELKQPHGGAGRDER